MKIAKTCCCTFAATLCVPTVPKSWKAKLSEDGKTCRIVKSGFVVIVK